MTEIWEALRAPFPPHVVSWRIGATNTEKTKGMALAYIDARDVMDRLDQVVGPENWECRYPHAAVKTVCEIGIKCDGNWVYKADGAGDTDTEAEKGALSDAFKRAAVRFGIGRYLYSLDSPWVEIEQRGRSYTIKESEKAKLQRLLTNAPVMALLPGAHNDTKTNTRDDKDKLCAEIQNCNGIKALTDWGAANASRIQALNADLQEVVRNSYIDRMNELKQKAAA